MCSSLKFLSLSNPAPSAQVWVVVLSNLIAIQLQTLAARLGLVTGKNLAQVGSDKGVLGLAALCNYWGA